MGGVSRIGYLLDPTGYLKGEGGIELLIAAFTQTPITRKSTTK